MLYLDNAATSYPKPEEVYRAMDYFLRNQAANPGRAAFRMAVEAERLIYDTRLLLKDFFNLPSPEQVVFTLNCTEALNIVLKGLLNPGDHVITSSLEHNSVSRPLNRLQADGVDFSIVNAAPDGAISPEEIAKLIRHDTKLIVLTHASNVLGTIEPVKEIGEIAAEKGVLFILDAAQTAGAIPLDMLDLKISVLACPGHKGLMGPPGTGVLAIRDDLEITSLKEGGTGSFSEEPFQPSYYPDRLEAGTPNTVGIAGLKAGLGFIKKEGLANIREHEVNLLKLLMKELSNIPNVTFYGTAEAVKRTGLVSFNIEGWDPQDAAAVLETRFDVACRAGLHCSPWAHRFNGTYPEGSIRFGISYFNTESEIRTALDAVATLAKAF